MKITKIAFRCDACGVEAPAPEGNPDRPLLPADWEGFVIHRTGLGGEVGVHMKTDTYQLCPECRRFPDLAEWKRCVEAIRAIRDAPVNEAPISLKTEIDPATLRTVR